MTEPQVWVLIAVFSAAIFAMLGIVTASFNRTLTSAISGLRDRMDSRFEAMDSKFEAMDSRFEGLRAEVNGKFNLIEVKLEHMDADIQAISRHVFGTEPH